MKEYTPIKDNTYTFFIKSKCSGNLRHFTYYYISEKGRYVFFYEEGNCLVEMTKARFNYLCRISPKQELSVSDINPCVADENGEILSEEIIALKKDHDTILENIKGIKDLSADEIIQITNTIGFNPKDMYDEFLKMFQYEIGTGEKDEKWRALLIKDFNQYSSCLAYLRFNSKKIV